MPANPNHALPPYDSLPGGTEYSFTRDFDAPRELLFEAWTNPAHMAQWWGPKGFTNPVCEMDLRPGGRFRIDMCGPDGMVYPFKGAYIEIDPPARLVYSNDTYDHPEEWHDLVNPNRKPGELMPCPITTITFEDIGGKTRLSVRMSFATTDLREAHLQVGMHSGWTESMVKLDALLSGEEAGSDDTVSLQVTRRYDATAGQVYDAWLNPDVARRFFFATPEGEMLRVEIDARMGGRFVVVEKRGELEAFHTGEYLMLAVNARPKIIAFSFSTDLAMVEVSRVRVHIVPLESGCELTLIHELDKKWADHLERPRAGWTRMLEMLATALAGD